jgi:hypothetical protein
MVEMRKMSRLLVVSVALLLFGATADAQLRSDLDGRPSASETMLHPATGVGSFLGFLNSENFSMRHNFSMNFLSSGSTSLSLASYTNSMFYKIADPLNVRFDITLQGSPFGNYASARQGDLSKLYISRAEVNYRPWENFSMQLQYRQIPFGYYDRFYSPYYSPMWGDE